MTKDEKSSFCITPCNYGRLQFLGVAKLYTHKNMLPFSKKKKLQNNRLRESIYRESQIEQSSLIAAKFGEEQSPRMWLQWADRETLDLIPTNN